MKIELFDFVQGEKVERYLARRVEAQRALYHAREVLYQDLRAKFDLHNQPGGSDLVRADGKVDKHVELDDTAGDHAAAAIWTEVFGLEDSGDGVSKKANESHVFKSLRRRGKNFTWGGKYEGNRRAEAGGETR